jgi:hypothetical protein
MTCPDHMGGEVREKVHATRSRAAHHVKQLQSPECKNTPKIDSYIITICLHLIVHIPPFS